MKKREFSIVPAKTVVDYFAKGFESTDGKIQRFEWWYDAQKQTFIFELYVDYGPDTGEAKC